LSDHQFKMSIRDPVIGRIYFLAVIVLSLFTAITQGHAQETRTLDVYIETALANSPLLHDYHNQVLAAGIDKQLIGANYKPQVNVASNAIYAPVWGDHGYDEAISNGGTYNALASVSKTFVGKANLGAQYNATRLVADSTINTTKTSEQDIKRTVTTQYLIAYGDQQQLANNKRIHKLLAQEDVILKKLTENNIYRQTDYLTFLVTYKQHELQLKQMWLQYQTDYANLNYTCGIVDTDARNVTLADPALELSPLLDPSRSAFFYKFLLDSMRLQNEITLIRMSYRPKLSVFGDAGFNSSQPSTFFSHYGASAGVNFTLPVYDGHRKRLHMDKIDLLEDTRTYYRDFFTAQYRQQVGQFLQQLRATEQLLHDIQDQVKYTEGLISVNAHLLQTGDAKISDFVIAINNYLTAQYLVTQNQISRYQVINQVNYWNR
jgi:outer membrane protein TolC